VDVGTFWQIDSLLFHFCLKKTDKKEILSVLRNKKAIEFWKITNHTGKKQRFLFCRIPNPM
jgi:hypothetical protein